MDISVKSATQAQPMVQSKSVNQKSTQEKTDVPVPKDTVQVSSAALAALQESKETAAQTAKEAAGGDRQAQKLLAKEAAAKEAATSEVAVKGAAVQQAAAKGATEVSLSV